MALAQEKSFPRLWSINEGVLMVVTDLHGDWDLYERYRDRFLRLHAAGKADGLLFTGDLIHTQSPQIPDKSVEIVLDILRLQAEWGDAVICLCGNHELPHIYGFPLSKGDHDYTPPFETAVNQSRRRAEIALFFHSLPFFVRTAVGVSFHHAGAATAMAPAGFARQVFNWDHQATLATINTFLAQKDMVKMRRVYARLNQAESYDALARHYLAVTGEEDPRYDDLIRYLFLSTVDADFLRMRSLFFAVCEAEDGEAAYAETLNAMLQNLSLDYMPRRWLVAGHMKTEGGYEIIAGRHLRLSSGVHARPREAGRYLLLDIAQPIYNVSDLERCLRSIF